MGSLDLQLWTHIGTMNPVGAPDSDPARREVVSIEPHRSAALRFMGSLDLQLWTHIGTMNLAGAPDSDPARRKGHFHRAASECGAPVHGKPRPPTLDAHWDHE